jgi:Sec-independent protein translocase protein TatA
MLNLGPLELVIILVVTVLAFGPQLLRWTTEAGHFIGRLKRSFAEPETLVEPIELALLLLLAVVGIAALVFGTP